PSASLLRTRGRCSRFFIQIENEAFATGNLARTIQRRDSMHSLEKLEMKSDKDRDCMRTLLEKRLSSISEEVSWEIQAVFHFLQEDIKSLRDLIAPKKEGLAIKAWNFVKTTIISVALAICYATLSKALAPLASTNTVAQTKSDSSPIKMDLTALKGERTSL